MQNTVDQMKIHSPALKRLCPSGKYQNTFKAIGHSYIQLNWSFIFNSNNATFQNFQIIVQSIMCHFKLFK
jgi:hypothetical protein